VRYGFASVIELLVNVFKWDIELFGNHHSFLSAEGTGAVKVPGYHRNRDAKMICHIFKCPTPIPQEGKQELSFFNGFDFLCISHYSNNNKDNFPICQEKLCFN